MRSLLIRNLDGGLYGVYRRRGTVFLGYVHKRAERPQWGWTRGGMADAPYDAATRDEAIAHLLEGIRAAAH